MHTEVLVTSATSRSVLIPPPKTTIFKDDSSFQREINVLSRIPQLRREYKKKAADRINDLKEFRKYIIMDIRTNRKELRVNMDYMEQRLFDLYDKYLYSYDELRKKALAETCYREYSKGGEGTHRGYYCPSPVIDLVIGNVSRGRLLKRRPAANYDYIYYLNEARQIIMVDAFATWENGRKTLYTREFVFHGENVETSVEYKLDWFLGYIHMYSASLCDYDAGKLRTYKRLIMDTYCRDDGSFYTDKDSFLFQAEDYEYDEFGLMCRYVWGEQLSFKEKTRSGKFKPAGYTQEYAYKLFHNEEGFMYAYKSLEPRPDGLDPMYYVAKSKLRKI